MQEVCAGRAAAADELKAATGTMQCRKNVLNTSHFRTIAPKIASPIVNPCTPSSYGPSLPDICTKPVVMPTQNYTLMKVAVQDGTYSLVALPQVTQPIGAQAVQTTNIPLQENLKLPIPRYLSSRNKTLLDKKAKGTSLNRTAGKKTAQVEHNGHSEIIPNLLTEENIQDACSILTPGTSPVNQTDAVKVHTSISYTEKCLQKAFCGSSTIKVCADDIASLVENGPLMSKKVANSANSLTVLSQVMFGSPVRVLPSVPKGKLPILPYSKIKKAIISKRSQLVEKPTTVADSNFSTKSPSHETFLSEVPNLHSEVVDSFSPANLCLSGSEPEPDPLKKPNGAAGKKRGRKRKSSSERMGYQKIKLIGSKLVYCEEKLKMHSVEPDDKKDVALNKYRTIMPKPVIVGQSLAALGSSTAGFQSFTTDSGIQNILHLIKENRGKPGDGMVPKQVGDLKSLSSATKAYYKCHICEHSFQFKHHLQDHLNTHANRKPYHCRLCRKSYVHSGSLSTHMKLHHGESRLKKLMCCEFCGKVFGHIKVYFGHLKEVHRVIISTETSTKHLGTKDMDSKGNQASLIKRESNSASEEHSVNGQTVEIKLQIKCGHCHVFMPTFSNMKEHLLFEHGEKFEDRSQEGVLESHHGAQEEVVKNATHYWKLLNERRNVRCSSCGEGFLGPGKLRKHTCFPSLNEKELLKREPSSPKGNQEDIRKEDLCFSASGVEVRLWCGDHLNCILCKQVFGNKLELLTHWQQTHNCEDPLLLWAVFTSFP